MKSESDFDAILVRFPGWENITGWIDAETYDVPAPTLFQAKLVVTRQTDYPANDVYWPLMSRHMIDVLRATGDFAHRTIPVRLIDRSVRPGTYDEAIGALPPDVVDDRFSIVQLLEHLDAVDWERSEFSRSRISPTLVRMFFKLVLAPPAGGFPPLFRLSARRSNLYVSPAAHAALTAAGIRGVTFEPVPAT